jgi:hypothetical protein
MVLCADGVRLLALMDCIVPQPSNCGAFLLSREVGRGITNILRRGEGLHWRERFIKIRKFASFFFPLLVSLHTIDF